MSFGAVLEAIGQHQVEFLTECRNNRQLVCDILVISMMAPNQHSIVAIRRLTCLKIKCWLQAFMSHSAKLMPRSLQPKLRPADGAVHRYKRRDRFS